MVLFLKLMWFQVIFIFCDVALNNVKNSRQIFLKFLQKYIILHRSYHNK